MNVVAKIKPFLYLGGAPGRTKEFLSKEEITLVINAAGSNPSTDKCSVKQIKIEAEDNAKFDLKQHFNKVADLIDSERQKGGKVYVHCIGGISRGPSLVFAYLMKYEKIPLNDAHTIVKEQRRFIRPNIGFWTQLIEFEYEIFGKNSVTLMLCGTKQYPSVYEEEYKNMVT